MTPTTMSLQLCPPPRLGSRPAQLSVGCLAAEKALLKEKHQASGLGPTWQGVGSTARALSLGPLARCQLLTSKTFPV